MNSCFIASSMAGVFEERNLENPALSLADAKTWEAVFNDSFTAETGDSVTSDKALMYAPLWHAVQLISGDVSRIPLHVYRRRLDISDDARERDRAHPLNRLLAVAANPETEAVKFWGRYMLHALLWGNGYAFIDRDGSGQPIGLYNLLPDRTHAEWIEGRMLYVTEAGGRLKAMLPEDVLHVEGLSVGSAGGMTVFRMARNAIALGLAQEKFASKFFKHGGRVGGILELPAAMGKGARDTVETGFSKSYEGTDNPFKTIVLRDNAKFHAAQQSPRDSQMVEATEAQTRQIAHWFNLMPSKLGLSDSVSYNSKAEDNQNYLDTTLSIWLVRIAAACNFKLFGEQDGDVFAEHNTAGLLRMNTLAQAQAFQILVGSKIMSPNECRARLNMLPYDGGDEFADPAPKPFGKPEDKPIRSAEQLRALFNLTAKARSKAKNSTAFCDWIDFRRDEYRAEWEAAELVAPGLLAAFRKLIETNHADKLPGAVDAACLTLEESK